MKKHDLTSFQFLTAGGVYFPIAFGALFTAESLGANLGSMSEWTLGSVMIALVLVVYLGVHFVPRKISLPLGFAGWLVIPGMLVVMALR